MSTINPLTREISAKIVYYGPALSGKTTSLKYIHSSVKPTRRGDMITLATEGDRTIFFDFLPLQVDKVRGMTVRLQLYTVPGQVYYAATRKLVLKGTDGVVFVADSQKGCADSNLESMRDLRQNLADSGKSLEELPFVIQYNKRDLEEIESIDDLSRALNPRRVPEFPTQATDGDGVLLALKETIRLVIRSLWKRETGKSEMPDTVAPRSSLRAVPVSKGSAAMSTDSIVATLSDAADRISEESSVKALPAQPLQGELTFSPLWSDGDPTNVLQIENAIRAGNYPAAVRAAANVVAELLADLPGAGDAGGAASRAMLLGIDGREYLKMCRLASEPNEALSELDALFAYHLVISARIKARGV